MGSMNSPRILAILEAGLQGSSRSADLLRNRSCRHDTQTGAREKNAHRPGQSRRFISPPLKRYGGQYIA
jgi:hypothetical protein